MEGGFDYVVFRVRVRLGPIEDQSFLLFVGVGEADFKVKLLFIEAFHLEV